MDIFCNLLPEAGDFDFGESEDAAFPARIADEVFEMPVRVNTGDANFGAAEIVIYYDGNVLEPLSQGSKTVNSNIIFIINSMSDY